MQRLLAVLTHAALRLVIAFMMAAGGAALVAVVFVARPPSSSSVEWIVPIRQAALAIGFAFLGAAVIALRVLPSRRELIRFAVSASERALPGGVLLLVVGLAGVSAWQFLLRREPSGPSLLTVQPERGAWPFRSSYVLAEASSGGIIGILEPAGADWNVLDRFRRPLAQVERVDARRGYCRYRIRVDQAEVCRFTWAMHGFGVWTAEMDIEFSNGAAQRLDPSYAMALAPILEAQARRTSQRMD